MRVETYGAVPFDDVPQSGVSESTESAGTTNPSDAPAEAPLQEPSRTLVSMGQQPPHWIQLSSANDAHRGLLSAEAGRGSATGGRLASGDNDRHCGADDTETQRLLARYPAPGAADAQTGRSVLGGTGLQLPGSFNAGLSYDPSSAFGSGAGSRSGSSDALSTLLLRANGLPSQPNLTRQEVLETRAELARAWKTVDDPRQRIYLLGAMTSVRQAGGQGGLLTPAELMNDPTVIDNAMSAGMFGGSNSIAVPRSATPIEASAGQSFRTTLHPARGIVIGNKSTLNVDAAHLSELTANGVKFTPGSVIATGRNSSGQVVFMETGNARAGLRHIVDAHAEDFASIGVPEARIPNVVMHAATHGKVSGYQGADKGRPIFEISLNGRPQKIAVTIGNNGFIVGANPAGGGW